MEKDLAQVMPVTQQVPNFNSYNFRTCQLFKHVGVTFQNMITRNFFGGTQRSENFLFASSTEDSGHASSDHHETLKFMYRLYFTTLKFSVSTLFDNSYKRDSSIFLVI